jgi:hypothetical protein
MPFCRSGNDPDRPVQQLVAVMVALATITSAMLYCRQDFGPGDGIASAEGRG